MKKRFLLILCALLVLSLSACSSKSDNTELVQQPDATATALPEVPPTAHAVVRASDAPVLLKLLNRGDIVTVLGVDGDYYVVEFEDGAKTMVQRCLIRLDNEEAYTPWDGFAVYGALAYSDRTLEGEPLTLELNTPISVIEEFNGLLLASVEDKQLYIDASDVSPFLITYNPYSESDGGYGGGGGSGGGFVSSDGGDIQVTAAFSGDKQLHIVLLTDESQSYPRQGMVLADQTEAILAFHIRGDEEQVLLEGGVPTLENGYYLITLDNKRCLIKEKYLRLDDESAYEEWTGFTKSGTAVFSDVQQRDTALRILNLNSEIKIVDKVGNMFVVELDGIIGYVFADMVGETKFYSYSSDGGSVGGGAPADGGAEWSPPIL